MKEKVAIWIYGGIGTGHFSQGLPMLEKIVQQLSSTFDITVYSQSVPNEGYVSNLFEIKSAPSDIRIGLLRWIHLARITRRDHNIRKYKFIIAFWGYPAGVFASVLGSILRIPSVIYLLGSDSAGIPSINFGILHKTFPRLLAKWSYRNATLLVALSGYQKDILTTYGITTPMKIVPWGADASLFPFRKKKPGATLHVIHVGHLNKVKDQETLLKAFALIISQRPAVLKIFGVDCLDGEMQRLCVRLNIDKHVSFCDMVPYDKMADHYAWADVMLHTSYSEGQSMALTEAAASGVLLAGTNVPPLYDMGEDCGVIVDRGEFEELSRKVLAILDRPAEWEQKIECAWRWSRDHEFQRTIVEIRNLLQSL